MPLSPLTLLNLKRINARLPEKLIGKAVEALVNQIDWPDTEFSGSVERMRQHLTEKDGLEVADWSDQEVSDEMPSLFQFRFLARESWGEFWPGWAERFPLVNTDTFTPFASDDYYFYFLAQNPEAETDPLVFSVDHEETDQEPYDEGGLTVSRLLSIIEPATNTQ